MYTVDFCFVHVFSVRGRTGSPSVTWSIAGQVYKPCLRQISLEKSRSLLVQQGCSSCTVITIQFSVSVAMILDLHDLDFFYLYYGWCPRSSGWSQVAQLILFPPAKTAYVLKILSIWAQQPTSTFVLGAECNVTAHVIAGQRDLSV